ncbi:hypothetical protein DFH07DRAFT_965879 [Mycena maculata]|uniref:DUF6534 domain-containing protein n=1 Tax=Mycena maculata TaxID=230809 RepID=A0AAD7ID14_9AGAR|nr:hypothetical protein DFH07DRAFT_965879 [Mycena maculata]
MSSTAESTTEAAVISKAACPPSISTSTAYPSPKDRLVIKFLVYFTLLAMTVCTVLSALDIEFWFGRGFDTLFYHSLMGSIIATLCSTADVLPQTRDVLKNIVRLVETNIFSATVALLGLFLLVGIPNATYFSCPIFVLPRIYANTLLVSLNTRAISRSQRSSPAAFSTTKTPFEAQNRQYTEHHALTVC